MFLVHALDMSFIKPTISFVYILHNFSHPDVKQPSILDALSKPKPASNTAAKKVPSFDSSDSEGERKAPAKKAKPVQKRKPAFSSDDDGSSDDLMSRLKTKTNAGTKVGSH